MAFDGMRLCVAALILCGLSGATAPALGQGTSALVDVVPLLRSAAFSFRLDQVAPTRYVKGDYGPLYEPIPVATLEWRVPGSTDWKKAQPFVRVQADRFVGSRLGPDPRMATMLFGLREGSDYEYRVVFKGTGFPTAPTLGRFTTLSSNAVGARSIVPITVGPDTTTQQLRAALTAALSDVPANNAGKVIELRSALGPGKRTVVRASLASIYEAGPWSWSGVRDGWLTVRTAPEHQIIFDGSASAFDVTGAGNWKPFTDPARGITSAHGIYVSNTSMARPAAVYYEKTRDTVGIRLLDVTANEPFLGPLAIDSATGIEPPRTVSIQSIARAAGSTNATVTTSADFPINAGQTVQIAGVSRSAWNGSFKAANVNRDLGRGLYQFTFQTTDGSTAASASGGSVSAPGAVSTAVERATQNGGFFSWEADSPGATTGRLYVRLHNGVDPNTVYMKIPVRPNCLDLNNVSFVSVEGLTIQYYGTQGTGNFGGIGLISVSDVIVKNNTMRCLTEYIGHHTSSTSPKTRVIIKGNRFEEKGLGPDPDDPGFPRPNWHWIKASRNERIGVPLFGRGVSLSDNVLMGMFNGTSGYVGVENPAYDGTQTTYPEAWEIDGNTFIGIGDDSIEPEQWAVNYAVVRNTFRSCYKGVSLAPAIGGPYYVLRNTWLGRGEYVGTSDKQAFLKMGNDYPGDPGYKLVAQNTIVNINADTGGVPLVGIANSGSTINHYYYNNYVASDSYPIDMGYGSMGYPHLFDGNRYRSRRFSSRIPGYDLGFALGRIPVEQGEDMPGSDHRNAATFDDWQRGRSVNNSPQWPGYDGVIPTTPRVASTPGTSAHPGEKVAWLHDPHGSFSEGAPELVAPFQGDFRPLTGSLLIGGGVPEANITFDCGPAWSEFEESGRPTVGALPGGSSGQRTNNPPTVTVESGVVAKAGSPISVTVTYSDWDGTVDSTVGTVTDPTGTPVSARMQAIGEGVSSVVFTPSVTGLYPVKVVARDDKGATAEATSMVNVVADEPGLGELTVTMTASKANPVPGEPLVFTITIANPTNRRMASAQLRQIIPAQMTVNTSSVAVDGKVIGGSFSNGTLQVDLGDMAPGQTKTVTVTAIVK